MTHRPKCERNIKNHLSFHLPSSLLYIVALFTLRTVAHRKKIIQFLLSSSPISKTLTSTKRNDKKKNLTHKSTHLILFGLKFLNIKWNLQISQFFCIHTHTLTRILNTHCMRCIQVHSIHFPARTATSTFCFSVLFTNTNTYTKSLWVWCEF